MPVGEISSICILKSSPEIVLSGILGDGLYVKDGGVLGFRKITDSGIPNTGNVLVIKIDENISDVYASFMFDNSSADTMLVLRSVFEPPECVFDNEATYYAGNNIYDAEIVYYGTGDYSTSAFEDNSKSLKGSLPYYYRFYTKEVSGYVEKGTISGTSASIDSLEVVTSSGAFTGLDLSGRIIELRNRNSGESMRFEIESNTDDTITLIEDDLNIINNGNALTLKSQTLSYVVQSTIRVTAVDINPIYIVMEDSTDDIGRVYVSVDNGSHWTEKNTGIDSSVNSISIVNERGVDSIILDSKIYASADDGVFVSENSGNSWERLSEDILSEGYKGLPDGVGYISVEIDNEDNNIVYAISNDGNTYRTTDNGYSWDSIDTSSNTINIADIISRETNYIYMGIENSGLNMLDDSIRDSMGVEIETTGKITYMDIDYFEMGDSYFSDGNSISANTVVRNDSISDTREQVRFKVDENTNFISFDIKKNDKNISKDLIFVGDTETNSYGNPFVLENPKSIKGNMVINKIVNLDQGEIFSITNKGVYLTENNGDKWTKINSSLIPDGVLDIGTTADDEIILATEENGLWVSKNNRSIYRNIEQKTSKVNVLWETVINGTRRIYRGGDNGLYITVERPVSRSMIVFSGPSLTGGDSIAFSWGDIFNEVDGGWSESTSRKIEMPTTAYDGKSWNVYEGWAGALMVRKGPYLTYNKAETDAINNDIFAPMNNIMYPTFNPSLKVFSRNGIVSNPEEILDQNISGYESIGVSLSPKAYMNEGNIVVGRLINSASVYPSTGNSPTTDLLIIDRMQPITGSDRLSLGMIDSIADSTVGNYGATDELAPIILPERYYIYRAYPYRMIPAPDVFVSNSELRPTFPKYIPSTGDMVDSYSYKIDIKKFTGAKTITCASSLKDGNFVIGTDVGIFYSTENGMNVIATENDSLKNAITSIYCTSGNSVIVSVSGVNGIEIYKNTKNINDSDFDSGWIIFSGIINVFNEARVTRIYNFAEDGNGMILASTNRGVFSGDIEGSNWTLTNTVGYVESLIDGRVLQQQIRIN